MGQTLSEPVVEKISESGEDTRLAYGISSMQGWRVTMEDAHAAVLDLQKSDDPAKIGPEGKISFFGVYDGHGGDKVALFSGENVHKILAKQSAFKDSNYEQALKDGFLATDRAILQDPQYNDEVSGCTASTALISDTKIYVANAGDSRTVLGVKGRAKPLSFDHKPQNEGEKARICAAGGFVDFGRVNGNLALSRAIGDFEFKKSADLPPEQQIVTAFPDVVIHEISDDDEFLVIACDGIWDCQSSQAVIEFVRRGIAAKQELHTICENMMDNCLASSSETGGVGCDNMTMIVVALLRNMSKEEWYDLIAKRVADGDGPCAPPEYAEFRGPGVHPTSFDDSPDEFDARHPNNSVRSKNEAGRIIMLGDGTEVLTDSDDAEMLDEESDKEEEKDDEALERIAAKEKREEDEEMKDDPKSEKGKENEKIDISSKTQGTTTEPAGQKGESAIAK
ncbi:PP2C-domain-containing protein [Choiromyces venosus 120613-1]|uniref:Protein phosphatase 2C homolog 2 n=1 Tax=Choiromyces venosus 120613-1 TaxID=1336337 RepID=A0A3N4JNX6_9PEZI|nr:PP2C-domain-containing protein [Choiromyces venosus 120613-1]